MTLLHHREELDDEKDRDDICQDGNFLGLAGENLDDHVGDHCQTNAVADGAGDGHCQGHDEHGNDLIYVVKVDVLQTLQHQDADINQRGRGRRGGNDGCDGGNEHTGQEHKGRGEGGKTRAAARLNTGGRLHEGRDGGGTAERACDGTHCIRGERFLHLGHIAVLIGHTGAGCRADQRADGVEHIDHAEGDNQGDGREPTDLEETAEVELEESDLCHVIEVGQEGGRLQRLKRIGAQENKLSSPVADGGDQHTHEHSGLLALLAQKDDDKEADEHCNHIDHHGFVAYIAHGTLNRAGCHGAEEVTHHKEGRFKVVALAVYAGIRAKADVHQHQTDRRTDAQTNAQRNRCDDLIADIKDAEQDEHDALYKNDADGRLECGGVIRIQQGGNVATDHSEKAVQAHAGCHDEGLICQKCHGYGADCRGNAGRHKDRVPQMGTDIEVGQQIRIQGDDIRHCHECRQTGKNLCLNSRAVFF